MYKLTICKLVALFVLIDHASCDDGSYAVMAAESSSERENFCVYYYKQFSKLPAEKSDAAFHILQDARLTDFCSEYTSTRFEGKVVLLTQNNCSITHQALAVQQQGGRAAVFIPIERKNVNLNVSAGSVTIPVVLILKNSAQRLMTMRDTITVCLYAPTGFGFDFSLFIVWIVAVFTVSVGSYWSGHVRKRLFMKEITKKAVDSQETAENEDTAISPSNTGEESSLNVSTSAVAVFVACMIAILLLLYFFFDYLVYFLIAVFAIVSISSVYSCLHPFIMRVLPAWFNIYELRLVGDIYIIDYRRIILLTISLLLAISWVVTRKEGFSWILQDTLGVAFCINMLCSIRLPSLKICSLFSILLFFYDIFFVFITPFLTAKGQSVMEEVATGGQSEETVPMLLRIPQISLGPFTICYQQYSLLGFGDILVPGMLVSYCYGFDLIIIGRCVYFGLTLFAYGIGLLLTFVGLFLMNTAQPALLYLVPVTLIPPVLLGWKRGELNLLWNGLKATDRKVTGKILRSKLLKEISSNLKDEIQTISRKETDIRDRQKWRKGVRRCGCLTGQTPL